MLYTSQRPSVGEEKTKGGIGDDNFFSLLENLLFKPMWTLEEGQLCLTGAWLCLCPLTEDEEIQEVGLAGGIVPEANAAGVGPVVLHGHGADGDADVPAVDIANELDAVVVALPVLHEPIKIPRHSIILAEREGTGSVWVSCVSLQCNSMDQPALKEQLGKEDLKLHQVEKKPRKT